MTSHSRYRASSSARNRPAQSALSEPPAWIPPEYIGFLFLSLLPIYRIQSIFREFRACTVCRTSPVLYIMEPAVANGCCRLVFYLMIEQKGPLKNDKKYIFRHIIIRHETGQQPQTRARTAEKHNLLSVKNNLITIQYCKYPFM